MCVGPVIEHFPFCDNPNLSRKKEENMHELELDAFCKMNKKLYVRFS